MNPLDLYIYIQAYRSSNPSKQVLSNPNENDLEGMFFVHEKEIDALLVNFVNYIYKAHGLHDQLLTTKMLGKESQLTLKLE